MGTRSMSNMVQGRHTEKNKQGVNHQYALHIAVGKAPIAAARATIVAVAAKDITAVVKGAADKQVSIWDYHSERG